jgi:cell division protein FtsQ
MTINNAATRSEVVRRRRTQSVPQSQPQKIKRSYRPETIQVPVKSNVTKRSTQSRGMPYNTNRRHIDFAFNTPRSSVRTPGITLPTLGPRLASGVLIIVMGLVLLTLWNSSMFQISGAQVTGNQRLSEAEINAALQVIGKPIFTAVPEQIQKDLVSVYPDIASVKVKIALPNRVIVNISERTPTILWQESDGTAYWIDSQGVKFPARGQVENLVTVFATGDPQVQQSGSNENAVDAAGPVSAFINPSMIKTITELAAIAPSGAAISFDPSYGLGWSDPRGWLVYFGENTQNVTMQMTIYQAIIDKLSQQGVQPTMISVEYLDAPFYRTQ